MSRRAAPPLLAIFRSQLQADVLTALMLNPGSSSVQDLAAHLGVPQPTVYREVARLIAAGLIVDERVGRTRLLSPNTENPAFGPLRDLVLIAFGPREVVDEEFSELEGLEGLFIHGSWAARYAGEEGKQPGDIDVIAVGDVDRTAAFEAAERAQQRLRREVNVQVIPRRRWEGAQTPFLREVQQRPLVAIRELNGELTTVDGGN